ncbi:MAG: hypothetical protein DM484_11490 [Candidatus Methylumidiphilus alinenensis]|uniref:Uncharacterized protein n=1 Tax=Candidatus Methylumidiphilus alinenensis TaxID=2202197 RepID=A0A2W4R625_9GAMM|nr:MAG: hypothetical protein DM484_11490 [Candidatus Methylumidiphilus alinenensis]
MPPMKKKWRLRRFPKMATPLCKRGVAMKEWWERFLTATQAEKSRLKTAPTAVEFFMDRGVDATDMIVGGIAVTLMS